MSNKKNKDSRKTRKNNNYNLQKKYNKPLNIKLENNYDKNKNLSKEQKETLKIALEKITKFDNTYFVYINHLVYEVDYEKNVLILSSHFDTEEEKYNALQVNNLPDIIPFKIIEDYEFYTLNNTFYKIINHIPIEITEDEYNGEVFCRYFDYSNKEDVKIVKNYVLSYIINYLFLKKFLIDNIMLDYDIELKLYDKFPNAVKQRVDRIVKNICLNFPKQIDRTLFDNELEDRFEGCFKSELYDRGVDFNSIVLSIYNCNQNIYNNLVHDYRIEHNIEIRKRNTK